jgi:hypothetical protein
MCVYFIALHKDSSFSYVSLFYLMSAQIFIFSSLLLLKASLGYIAPTSKKQNNNKNQTKRTTHMKENTYSFILGNIF